MVRSDGTSRRAFIAYVRAIVAGEQPMSNPPMIAATAIPLPEALRIARESELDLVEVAPNATPPVCKIMDFGRWQYEQEQRRKESRKKATNVVIKDRKSTRLNSSHSQQSRMPSSA